MREPLGIPKFEDEVLQRAVAMLLEPIDEQDYASGRRHPAGGVIAPLLSNVYLHYVLDMWFEQEVKPRLAGRAFLIRYADNFVMVFQHEADARRVLEVLPKRYAKFGLTLHPEKTRLVGFVRPSRARSLPLPLSVSGAELLGQASGTFDLLGFTHYWGRSRNGYWVVKRKTARSRLRRAILAASEWCRRNLHQPVAEQHRTLCQKLRGHFAYYGITGNSWSLSSFREAVTDTWPSGSAGVIETAP